MKKVHSVVVDLLSEILSGDPLDMNAAFRLTPENGVAPIDIAKLAIACEKAFGIPLYNEKIAQWETVGDVCGHIQRLLDEGLAEPTQRTDADRVGWYYE